MQASRRCAPQFEYAFKIFLAAIILFCAGAQRTFFAPLGLSHLAECSAIERVEVKDLSMKYGETLRQRSIPAWSHRTLHKTRFCWLECARQSADA